MLFKYKIAGRQYANPDHTFYSGMVGAETPKEALLNALSEEFGDEADGETARERLIGWMDETDLESYDELPDDATCCCIVAGETDYDIAVEHITLKGHPDN